MALKVVSMEELKLQVLLEPERTGESVAELCARHGISRASFYRYRRRYLEEGAAGLEPREEAAHRLAIPSPQAGGRGRGAGERRGQPRSQAVSGRRT
jgi:transposase-like protein